MGRKRHTPEQIITALREAEVGLARGKSVKLISRVLGQPRTTQRRVRKVASDEGALRRGAVSESIRPLRLPTRHGHAPHRGLGGEPQAGGADLEAGGAEGPAAAAEARSAVAQRRIVHPAEAAVSGPRLVVRLRGLEDARRACAEAADSAGRAHEGVPGDRGGCARSELTTCSRCWPICSSDTGLPSI